MTANFPSNTAAELESRLAKGLCIECAQPFTKANVHSPDGWKETQISGMCEDCFDALFEEEDDL